MVDRSVFYNNSAFDGDNPEANFQDAGAIALDKTALLPGQTATFDNITSYDKGINGIAVDLAGPHGDITAADFSLAVGADNSPDDWLAAPAPASVVVFGGAGMGGSDRVELTWPDGTIQNEWLQVTVLANAHTGLATPDVFYFGNLVGDTGLGDLTNLALTNSIDQLSVRDQEGTTADVANVFDINRDGFVDTNDESIVAANSASLPLIAPPLSSDTIVANAIVPTRLSRAPSSPTPRRSRQSPPARPRSPACRQAIFSAPPNRAPTRTFLRVAP